MLMTTDLVNMLMPTVKMEDDRQLAAEAPTQYYDSTLLNLADNAGRMIDGAMIGPSLTDAAGTGIKAVGAVPDGTEMNILGGLHTRDRYMRGASQVAMDMLEKGAPVEDIIRTTGWFPDLDGQWKYEVEPQRTSITNKALDIMFRQQNGQLVTPEYMRLPEALYHNRLYNDFPDMQNVQVVLEPGQSGQSTYGQFQRGANLQNPGRITLYSKAFPGENEFWGTLEHEVDHAGQKIATEWGYPHSGGGSPDWINFQIRQALRDESSRTGTNLLSKADAYSNRQWPLRSQKQGEFYNLRAKLMDEWSNTPMAERLGKFGFSGFFSANMPDMKKLDKLWTDIKGSFIGDSAAGKDPMDVYQLANPSNPVRQIIDDYNATARPGYQFDIGDIVREFQTDHEPWLWNLDQATPYWNSAENSTFELYRALLGEQNARMAEDLAKPDAIFTWGDPNKNFLQRRAEKMAVQNPKGAIKFFDPRTPRHVLADQSPIDTTRIQP